MKREPSSGVIAGDAQALAGPQRTFGVSIMLHSVSYLKKKAELLYICACRLPAVGLPW